MPLSARRLVPLLRQLVAFSTVGGLAFSSTSVPSTLRVESGSG
jgi:hypothetical protein